MGIKDIRFRLEQEVNPKKKHTPVSVLRQEALERSSQKREARATRKALKEFKKETKIKRQMEKEAFKAERLRSKERLYSGQASMYQSKLRAKRAKQAASPLANLFKPSKSTGKHFIQKRKQGGTLKKRTKVQLF